MRLKSKVIRIVFIFISIVTILGMIAPLGLTLGI